MRAGLVVTIRVNPKDCQSILDLIDAVGFPRIGQSFSMLTGIALSSMLESFRTSGAIPEPDAFEYLNRMSQYIGQKRTAKKLQIAKAVHEVGSGFRAPLVPVRTDKDKEGPTHDDSVERARAEDEKLELPEHLRPTADQLRAGSRLKELIFKKEYAADSWSNEDQAEYVKLMRDVYG